MEIDTLTLVTGFFAIGVILFVSGLWLLHEYKRTATEDPGRLLSIEIFLNILKYGTGPGILAMTAIAIGVYFIGTSVFIGVNVLLH